VIQLKNKLLVEIIWIVAVIAILSWAAVSNASYLETNQNAIANPANSDPVGIVINVTGYQWAWAFEYPNGTITTDKLVLEVNQTYTLVITSKDVIHDLYIPQFGVQSYAVPGHPNQVTIEPKKTGTFLFECVEYCGEYHYEMRGTVVVT
jgi:heme/copper-type cytochrome/quinol oxidase subunit 2